MSRAPSSRRVLLGAGVLAAVGGLGVATWQRRRAEAGPGTVTDASSLWQQRWPTPDGGSLDMARLRGQPLVLNFWATWCAPCVREMPQLDRFHAAWASRQGGQVIGLAVDQRQPVQAFLARTPVRYPIGLVGIDGLKLMRQLGATQEGLPFTAVLDAQGKVRQRHTGETHFDQLMAWTRGL